MSRKSAGFTLMEVMVAMAILSVSAVLLLESHYASLELIADAHAVDTTNRLLDAAANYAYIQATSGEKRGEGDFGEIYPEYSYSFSTEEIEDEQRSGLYEVHLTMRTPTEDVERTFYVYIDALATEDEKPSRK